MYVCQRYFFSYLIGLQTFLLLSYFWFSCADLILLDTWGHMLAGREEGRKEASLVFLGSFLTVLCLRKLTYLSSLVSNSSEEIL